MRRCPRRPVSCPSANVVPCRVTNWVTVKWPVNALPLCAVPVTGIAFIDVACVVA